MMACFISVTNCAFLRLADCFTRAIVIPNGQQPVYNKTRRRWAHGVLAPPSEQQGVDDQGASVIEIIGFENNTHDKNQAFLLHPVVRFSSLPFHLSPLPASRLVHNAVIKYAPMSSACGLILGSDGRSHLLNIAATWPNCSS